MKKYKLSIIITLFAFSSFSQETIKYTDNENSTIEFKISTKEYFVKITNTRKKSLLKNKSITKTTKISENTFIIESDVVLGNYKSRKTKLSEKIR